MTKEEVETRIKAILDKDSRFKGADIKVKFTDKKDKNNETKNTTQNTDHR